MNCRQRALAAICGLLLLVACGPPGAAVPEPSPSATATSGPASPPPLPAVGAAMSTPDYRATVEAPGTAPRPDPRHVAVAPPPGGLATVRFPDDAAGIAALFAQLPTAIAGQPRLPQFDRSGPDRTVAGYGERPGGLGPRLTVQVISVPNSGFYPINWTAGDVVAYHHERGALPPGTPWAAAPAPARRRRRPPSARRRAGRAAPGAW